MLARLAGITNSVWFDPAWEAGVVRENDSGTWRITAVLSRPLFTQYTLAQGTLAIAPAEAFGPSGKRMLSFGGAHYLSGAPALAATLQGSASYSTVSLASRTNSATMIKFGWNLNAASPDNRINHYVSAAGNVNGLQRVQAGGSTPVTGSAVTITTVHKFSDTYSGSDYDAWLDTASETLTSGGANTRAPAALDDMTWGCQRSATTPVSFWVGLQSGIVICPGVLSAANRQGIEADLAAYHGY